MPGAIDRGVPDRPSDMAYNYDLGNLPRGRAGAIALAERKEARQDARDRARDAQQAERDRVREAHESYRDALAQQTARLHAATQAFQFNKDMTEMRRKEEALNDAAQFTRFYGMLKDNDPNRRAQVNELLSMFPNAIGVHGIQQRISDDNKRLDAATKAGLTPSEEKFLKEHGPGKHTDYAAIQKAAGNPTDPNHAESAIMYGRLHDLMKKSIGMPTGTPEGISREDYIKNIESTFEKIPGTNTPNPAYRPPPSPSTPAAENTQGWSEATLPQTAPVSTPATAAPATAPATAPTSQGAREFLQSMGFKKTADAGAAAGAASDRNELGSMLNETPETGFLSNKPAPTPTPTPRPEEKKEQFYTA